jgi:hypothetical protein
MIIILLYFIILQLLLLNIGLGGANNRFIISIDWRGGVVRIFDILKKVELLLSYKSSNIYKNFNIYLI